MLLFFATASFTQILIDNGGLIDPGTRYVLQGSKWLSRKICGLCIV